MNARGRAWIFGDNIPTDRIVKGHLVLEPMEVIVQHVLEDLNPAFPKEARPGDVLVAGSHFGQSSGRAIAPKALKAVGLGCVVADSLARTFYRNCYEIGLPPPSAPASPSGSPTATSWRWTCPRGRSPASPTAPSEAWSPSTPSCSECWNAAA